MPWNPQRGGRGLPEGRNPYARGGFRADRKHGRTRCRDSGPWAAMEASLTDMYDQALLGILQHVGNVEEFLRILFGFLYRKTDFYRLLLRPGDRLGFPPGAAQAMALQVPARPGGWRGLALLAARAESSRLGGVRIGPAGGLGPGRAGNAGRESGGTAALRAPALPGGAQREVLSSGGKRHPHKKMRSPEGR